MSEETASSETTETEEPVERDEAREALLASFTEALGDAVVESHILPGKDLWIRVSADAWRTAGEVARHRLRARYFGFLSAIDWMPSPYGRSMDSQVDRQLAGDGLPGESAPGEPSPVPTTFETGYAGGDTRFQVFARVAHIGEQEQNWGVTLKVDVPEDTLAVETWTQIYAGSDWHERETWEMFGIDFTGHPGIRHMYLPTGFEGNPLRKDFPLVARMVKPWPGIVDVEPMPSDETEDAAAEGADS